MNNTDLISRSALLTEYNDFKDMDCPSGHTVTADYMIELAEAAPTIDAVEVVRCRDCKHYQPEPMGRVLYCYQSRRWTEPDFYCADGAKMDVEVQDGTKQH